MVRIIVMFLSALILTAPIHCRASIAETLTQRHISTNLHQELILLVEFKVMEKVICCLKPLDEEKVFFPFSQTNTSSF